ncbi:MAG: hypothetical protein ACYDDN_07505 [Candidatus Desulforudaceae bacterium]
MSKPNLPDDLLRLIKKLDQKRQAREEQLARQLVRIYGAARKDLYIRLLELQGSTGKLTLQHIESTIQGIEYQLRYYTNLTAQARQKAADEAFLLGQDLGAQMLRSGGVNISVVAGVGLVNRGMVEALIGDIPKLAGKVEMDVLFRIRDELTRGAVLGESIPKLAKRIFGTGLTTEGLKKPMSLQRRCTVIARTEIIKASDSGYEDLAVKAQGVIGEEIFDAWITAGDERVAEPDRQLGNGTHPDYQSIPGYPGVYRREGGPRPVISTHPQCRCRRIPVLLSWLKSGALDIAELRGRAS